MAGKTEQCFAQSGFAFRRERSRRRRRGDWRDDMEEFIRKRFDFDKADLKKLLALPRYTAQGDTHTITYM